MTNNNDGKSGASAHRRRGANLSVTQAVLQKHVAHPYYCVKYSDIW